MMSRAVLGNGLVALIKRRTYSTSAAASRMESRAGAAGSNPSPSSTPNPSTVSPSSSSWVPDPVTGCYRPANRSVEIDAAEMRETLLSPSKTQA